MKRKTRRLTRESIEDFGNIDTLQAIHDREMDSMISDGIEEKNFLGIRGLNKGTYSDGEKFLQWKDKELLYDDFEAEIQERFSESEGDFEAWIHNPKNKGKIKSVLPELDWVFNDEDNYWESTKRFGKKFNENIHRPDVEDLDVPVTEQEKLLCKYIPDEVEEFCRKNGLEVTCGAYWHNPGEEQHIEIYVGIPEGDDQTDPKYDNIEENLEMLVNGIGDAENEGEKWGDASFQWISDEEIFGEVWPLEGEYAINPNGELAEESAGVEVPDDAVKVVADRAIELLESLGRSKNVIMYLIDPERTAVGGENTSELRNMVENRLWDWIEGDMPRNGNADYTLTELYEMIKSGEL